MAGGLDNRVSISVVRDIGNNPFSWGKGRADARARTTGVCRRDWPLAIHRGTPPEDNLMVSRQVSWLWIAAHALPSQRRATPVTLVGRRLTTYSCGGSFGYTVQCTVPEFPLARPSPNRATVTTRYRG
ncbi:hypothetical protein CHELA40_11746 [Chelatococcus asaccharovorans]|nr:hypothetical protein CHELA40_11746 [Chelatococcus asaccharovorans]CAH1684149.1 hypothetical protein CHELA17_63855 [Chelatococcus asaccharovorans]